MCPQSVSTYPQVSLWPQESLSLQVFRPKTPAKLFWLSFFLSANSARSFCFFVPSTLFGLEIDKPFFGAAPAPVAHGSFFL
jgi:hypothetical protein